MKFHPDIPVYGETSFRGDCPKEAAEQTTFFSRIRKYYPETYGLIATHVRNEGKKTFGQVRREAAEGMTKGASDIIIPGSPAFVCELKRRDHTLCSWQDGQKEYLLAAQGAGAFVCLALGIDGAWEAFKAWRSIVES
ncbi:hypothetical protein D3C85_377570 [compost metagenome]